MMEKLERVSQASGLWPQRPEPSPGVRSQSFCLAKRMPVSPDIRPSSLDSQSKRGLGLGPRQPASFLIQTWSTAAVYRRRQAQEGWGLVRGHIAQESYGPYRPPGPPDLSPLHTLTLKMKEGGSASWCKPLGGLDNPERPSAVPGVVLSSIERRSSTTSQADFQVSHVISQTVCFFVRKWGQW